MACNSAKTLGAIATWAILLSIVLSKEVTYPQTRNNYDYNAIVVYNISSDNVTQLIDTSRVIRPGFEFEFAGRVYNACWFHTDGGLSFDA